MQLKWFRAIKRGRFLLQGPQFPLRALRFPLQRPFLTVQVLVKARVLIA